MKPILDTEMTLKVRILQSLTRLFIILVCLTRSLFSEKMLTSNRCISGLMSNLIKKSWTVSIQAVHFAQGFYFLFSFFYNFFSNSFKSLFSLQYHNNIRLRISLIFFFTFLKLCPNLSNKYWCQNYIWHSWLLSQKWICHVLSTAWNSTTIILLLTRRTERKTLRCEQFL